LIGYFVDSSGILDTQMIRVILSSSTPIINFLKMNTTFGAKGRIFKEGGDYGLFITVTCSQSFAVSMNNKFLIEGFEFFNARKLVNAL
jgi:hypothetical protein